MKPKYKRMMSVIGAAALAIGLAACGSSDEVEEEEVVTPPPVVDPGPTELEMRQSEASTASDAAKTSSEEAATSATAAMEATANLATSQTNETARGLAMEAHTAAAMAMAQYEAAKTAAAAAAAATTVTAAADARKDAQEAQEKAAAYAVTAMEKSEAAAAAATGELKIVGTVKSVGDTTLDAAAGRTSETTGTGDDEETVLTGLLSEPTTRIGAQDGVAFVAAMLDNPDTLTDDESEPAVKYEQATGARTIKLGKTLDSADDTARLMIITKYAGTNSVNVFTDTTTANLTGDVMTDGRIRTGTDPDTFVTLTSVGTSFYEATGGQTGDEPNELDHTDLVTIGDKTESAEVFSYPGTDGVLLYVVRVSTTESTEEGVLDAVIYQHVDITAPTMIDGPDTDTELDETRVMATVPHATDYKHIHFGVWAGLSAAKASGSQTIADLGIGFLQNYSGEGMTPNAPVLGSASYSGNWVATIQERDLDGDGDIALRNGGATVAADFAKSTVKASLTGLATLEGTISGSSFSGTKATVGTNSHGLTAGGAFTGEMSGGFYGAGAAEAGGIFDFATKTNIGGAFRGAFGADRDDDN